MIYAMLDLKNGRVVDVMAVMTDSGESPARQNTQARKELAEVYTMLTGKTRKDFKLLQEGKEAVATVVAEQFKLSKPVLEKVSRSEGPVATARGIIISMKNRPRREVIEACAAAGVKRNTAGVQYQLQRVKAHPKKVE